MKKLLLFAGLPGVGKSTLSKRVSEKTGARIIDLDDFKRVVVDPTLVSNQIDPPELRWAYYKMALEHVFGLFEEGVSIAIMDEVFHLDSLRSQLEALCAENQVQAIWVEVQCDYDVVERRLQSKGREGHILSTSEALRMYLMFQEIFEEFPGDRQNHIVVENVHDADVDSLIENILQKA